MSDFPHGAHRFFDERLQVRMVLVVKIHGCTAQVSQGGGAALADVFQTRYGLMEINP
jgi:hypothetical protein